MIATDLQAQEVLVAECLSTHGRGLRQIGWGHWELALPPDEVHRAIARIQEDWLLLEVPLLSGQARQASRQALEFELLNRNAQLAGLAKFARESSDGGISVHAEIPLAAGFDVQRAIERSLHGLGTALINSNRSPHQAMSAGPEPVASESALSAEAKANCEEAGWATQDHDGGRLSITLDTRGEYYQAVFDPCSIIGGHRLLVELAAAEAYSPVCQRPLAVLLLTTTRAVRMVRAIAGQRDARTTLGLEVSLMDSVGATALDCSLSALSVACDLCGREVRALQLEHLAQFYVMSQCLSL